ncbi:hypothetical protein HBI60_260740, partial [Parastagonospora nodorum]
MQPRLDKTEGSVDPRKRKRTNERDGTNDLITRIRREGEFTSTSGTYIAENDNPSSLYQSPPTSVTWSKDDRGPVIPDKSPRQKRTLRSRYGLRQEPRNQVVEGKNDSSIAVPGADLTERYEIKKLLGEGTFGKVFQAYDRTEKTPCAIKVIKSVPEHRDAVRNELEVLQTLASNDKHNTNQ